MGRRWRELVWASLLICGCASSPTDGGAAAPLAPIHGLGGVSPEFFSAFDALRAAVDAHEDEAARQILQRTQRRMEARREASWEDMTRDERRSLEAADVLASGFARILDGRERVSALELGLEVEDRGAELDVVLQVESTWPERLGVRPGPATLREEFVWVSPVGRESRTVRYLGLDEWDDCEVGPGSSWRTRIASVEPKIPPGALAARWTWSLVLRSGSVIESGSRFPGMNWGVAPAEFTRQAEYLSTSPVEPHELVDYLERTDLTRGTREQILPPILERAVRIEVDQRTETMALLTPLVQRATTDKIDRMIPVLRWLARTNAPGGSAEAWREWMGAHGDPPEPRVTAGLDLPVRPIRY